jgi:hypothetical protein
VLRRSPGHQRQRQAATTYSIICAWCKQRQRYGDTWGPCTASSDDPNLSHGICPECFERERAKLDGRGGLLKEREV